VEVTILDAYWLDLGYLPYTPAFAIQEQLFKARLAGRLQSLVLLQENPPTFTIGRAGSANGGLAANLLLSPQELAQRGYEVLEVNRGGDVTYHGPGQIIASPLLYLGDIEGSPANCPNANAYLHRLEDVLIEVLACFGLQAGKQAEHPGVWLGDEKIGAVGIAVRHGYTFHGFSLNVNLDLSPFKLINPCGVPQMRVTSMQAKLGAEISLDLVKSHLRQVMAETFGLALQDTTWQTLQSAIPKE
jgi:lipoate-protein ligase B